jgi:predicted transposase/invertase (TIGR01784 family)
MEARRYQRALVDHYAMMSSARNEGIELGEAKTRALFVRNLFKMGMDIAMIKTATGLSDEEITAIQNGSAPL